MKNTKLQELKRSFQDYLYWELKEQLENDVIDYDLDANEYNCYLNELHSYNIRELNRVAQCLGSMLFKDYIEASK